ncbi:MAG: C-terminal helicase domain-containing protein, partial [Vulcanimicrobiaceae bacterium]
QKAPLVAALLADQLEGNDDKIVVFAYHRAVLNLLRDALAPFGVCYIDGDTTRLRREQQIDWFQTRAHHRVFLGQQDACKEGITLTAASRVVIVEPSWTADDNVQAAHRVARIGQTSGHCIVQLVALSGTIDAGIMRQCAHEARLAEETLS